jgi:hypothetical protein
LCYEILTNLDSDKKLIFNLILKDEKDYNTKSHLYNTIQKHFHTIAIITHKNKNKITFFKNIFEKEHDFLKLYLPKNSSLKNLDKKNSFLKFKKKKFLGRS